MPSAGTDEERFPELFNQTSINPRDRKRTVEMKVLVIGLMRTGTKSTKAALEILGFNDVYHMVSVMKNPKDCVMWQDAVNAKYYGKGEKFTRKEWDQLLGDCDACIDVPTALFMPELIEAYPDAKVIVSKRDPDKWYKSVMETVGRRASGPALIVLGMLDPFFLGKFGPMVGLMMKASFKKPLSDEKNTKEVYNELHEEVRALVPKEKLLEYQLGDGWEPICKFLDKDVPDQPFPFINESKEFGERFEVVQKLALRRIFKNVVPVIGAVGLLAGWYFNVLPRIKR